MRFLSNVFRVTAINENRPATGGMAAIHVAPAVTNHPALCEINAEFACGAQQHARLRFATITIRCTFTGMIANFHTVNRKPATHFHMNHFDDFPFEHAPAHIRLIRRHDE